MANVTDNVLNQLRTGKQQEAIRQAAQNKVNTDVILEQLKPQKVVPLAQEYVIPNHSGNLSKGKVLETPTEDLQPVNKAYVDAAVVGGGNVSSGAGAPASTPSTIGAIYIDTTNAVFYVAMGTSSSNDWKPVLTG